MKKSLTLLATHLGICIAKDESYGSKEITLARTIAAHNYIVLGREGFDDGLVFVTGDTHYSKLRIMVSSQWLTS